MFKKFTNKAKKVVCSIKSVVASRKAEGYVDTGVKILISVVVGALLLTLLYALFGEVIMPAVSTRISGLFNFAG